MTEEKWKKDKSVPEGFESFKEEEAVYRNTEKKANSPQVNFGRRGGPGRNMGQEVEKPKELRKTLFRLMEYFGKMKKMMIALVGVVILVTVMALAAPAIQGRCIDLIAGKKWGALKTELLLLLLVYLIQVGAGLAQTLLSAHLSQRIVRMIRHDLFRKIDNIVCPDQLTIHPCRFFG